MPYTQEQIETLRDMGSRQDELTPEQRILVNKHLQAINAQLGDTRQGPVPVQEPPAQTFGQASGNILKRMAPTIISALAPVPVGAAARVFMRQAPAMLRPFGSTVGTAMESAASGGAELGMQQAGLTEEDPMQAEIATVAPIAGQALAGGVKFGLRHAPGSSHVEQDILAAELRNAPERFIPRIGLDADTQYKLLDQKFGNIKIPQPKTRATAQQLIQQQQSIPEVSLRKKAIIDLSNQTLDELSYRNDSFPLKQARVRLAALRNEVRTTSEDSQVHNAMKLRAAAAMEDLDNAAKSLKSKEAATALMTANTAYRREMAQADLAHTIETKGIKTGDMRGLHFVKPRAILDWIKHPDSQFFRESMTPDELTRFKNHIADLPEMKIDFGSSKLGSWERAAMGAGLGIAGAVAGESIGGGGVASMAGGAAMAFGVAQIIDKLAWAMTSKVGQRIVKQAMKPTGQGKFGVITPEVFSSLSAAMASELRGNRLRDNDTPPPIGTNLVPFGRNME